MLKFVTAGGLRIDFLISHDGQAFLGLPGGNALYSAAGTAFWSNEVGLWARYGQNYPLTWLRDLANLGLNTQGLVALSENQDHRTFFAYTPEGQRDDTNPAKHFARINQPLPQILEDYIHSTPGQDDPDQYEPLALQPGDWPASFTDITAVHLSPLPLATHLHVPPRLRQGGVKIISVDPGERYMVPERIPYIRRILPNIDVFLPSDQEIKSLFGAGYNLWGAAQTLNLWGARIVVIKCGENGVLVLDGETGQKAHFQSYHTPGDPGIVDVTGAGDAFCGGFLVGLAETADPFLAAHYGLVSASIVIEGYGAMYALTIDKQMALHRLTQLRSRA